MSETKKPRGERIADRYLEVVNNHELTISDRLKVLNHEFKELNLMSVSEAARFYGISYPAMKKRINSGSEMYITVNGNIFVSPT